MRESERDPVQETSGGDSAECHIYEAESGAAGVDKLLPDRQHEGMAEERLQSMAAPQGTSRDTQTVEEAEDSLQESDEAGRYFPLWHDGEGHLQGGQFPIGPLSQVRHERGQLPVKRENPCLAQ